MAVPNLVVVLLCVLGAGAVVVVVSAFGYHFFWKQEPEDTPRDWNQASPEQGAYMRRVREYNLRGIVASIRRDKMMARRSAASGTVGYYEEQSTYGYGETATRQSSSHGPREIYTGYESNPSRHNGHQDKYTVWVNERTV